MSLPSLRQLQYLVALSRTLHFGQAAEACHVTQSTLSAGIRELESALGVVLFERGRGAILPTRAGRMATARALDVLDRAEALVRGIRQGQEVLSGPLSLGVIPTVGPYLLPRVLPVVRAAHPGLRFRLREDTTPRLLNQLGAGELDVAILAFPWPVPQFSRQLFLSERFMVALPRGHRLAGGCTLVPEALPLDELLLLEEGHCLTDHALGVCHLEDARHAGVFHGTSLYTLLEMVAGGAGITFVPEMAVASGWMGSADIELAPLAGSGHHREIGLVWRPSWPDPEALQQLGALMASAMRDER